MMMTDLKTAPALYKPGNYWSVYEKLFVPELKKEGLKNFRRRRYSVLSSFGAVDVLPLKLDLFKFQFLHNHYTRKMSFYTKFLNFINYKINNLLGPISLYGATLDEIRFYLFKKCKSIGESVNAKSIQEISMSSHGNPEDLFTVGKSLYTPDSLNYYLRYVYCSQHINFESIQTIIELGSGSGKQIEILKKLYPNICFYLFDIPPQLYVCEQYLKSVFPNDVVSYGDLRNEKQLPSPIKGKIFILGTKQFPLIEGLNKVDLFWNAASFQEMEPHLVKNYLSYVKEKASNIYLNERMMGKGTAKRKGLPGVLHKTTINHYKEYLDNYKLVDLVPAINIFEKNLTYSDSFWKKQ